MKTYLIDMSFGSNGLGYSAKDISETLNFLKTRNDKYTFHVFYIDGNKAFFVDGELDKEEIKNLIEEIRLTSMRVVLNSNRMNKLYFTDEEIMSKAKIHYTKDSCDIL